jgi:hypothetical protein
MMLSRLAYTIVGILVVALSVGATMITLNLWSGYPLSNPSFTTPRGPASQVELAPAAASGAIPETPVEALPHIQTGPFQWAGIAHLNAQPMTGMSVVPGQSVLRLITTPQDGYHTISGQFRRLSPNQVYRITAWVKLEAGSNVELEISDSANGTPLNHAVAIFDPENHAVISTDVATRQRGIDDGPDGWKKIWLDLMTSDGEFVIALRPTIGGAVTFRGDGRRGILLGGFEADPQG